MNKELREFRVKLRKALGNYLKSEGCSCCEGNDHGKHRKELGKLLNVKKYDDGSGYDFYRYTDND